MSGKKRELDNDEPVCNGVRGMRPRDLDQFFTKPKIADLCVAHAERSLASKLACKLNDFNTIIEPSFGDGAFVAALLEKKVAQEKIVFIDIDARDEKCRQDFLKYQVPKDAKHKPKSIFNQRGADDKKIRWMAIGNPPFGKNSSTAINFFNHAAEFSDVIAFVVPRTFCKASVQDKLDRRFFLVEQYDVPSDGFLFKGEQYDVPCVFQVWAHANFLESKKHLVPEHERVPVPSSKERSVLPRMNSTNDFVFVSPTENPHAAIRRVGVNAGRIFEEKPASCSEQSHFFIRAVDDSRREPMLRRLKSLELEKTPSKFDTAGCPSISKSELCSLYVETTEKN